MKRCYRNTRLTVVPLLRSDIQQKDSARRRCNVDESKSSAKFQTYSSREIYFPSSWSPKCSTTIMSFIRMVSKSNKGELAGANSFMREEACVIPNPFSIPVHCSSQALSKTAGSDRFHVSAIWRLPTRALSTVH